MTITPSQRWRDRRESYRRPDEPFVPSRYEVVELHDDSTAKAFVVQHHYTASYPAARLRFGLYGADRLVGVAVLSQPMQAQVLACLPGEPSTGMELGRFVLLDHVPYNGETWFLGRCWELLARAGVSGVVSFSDPLPRETTLGRVVHGGHVGTIYQAHNGRYLGQSARNTIHLLPDGSVLSWRAISKIRARERGHRYSAALLERHGAAPLGDGDPRAWLAAWLPRVTRTIRHPGNHKYIWAVDRRLRRYLPKSRPFPKLHGGSP